MFLRVPTGRVAAISLVGLVVGSTSLSPTSWPNSCSTTVSRSIWLAGTFGARPVYQPQPAASVLMVMPLASVQPTRLPSSWPMLTGTASNCARLAPWAVQYAMACCTTASNCDCVSAAAPGPMPLAANSACGVPSDCNGGVGAQLPVTNWSVIRPYRNTLLVALNWRSPLKSNENTAVFGAPKA